MIKQGTLCVWQNCVAPVEYLNGTDVIAMSGLQMIKGRGLYNGQIIEMLGYKTDFPFTTATRYKGFLAAKATKLREKNPPPDELIDELETPLNKVRELT